MPRVESRLLTTLSAGECATVSHITDDSNADLLQYLAQVGIRPGKRVHVSEVAPFDGPLTVEVDEQRYVTHSVARPQQQSISFEDTTATGKAAITWKVNKEDDDD